MISDGSRERRDERKKMGSQNSPTLFFLPLLMVVPSSSIG